ncbi:amyloid-beta A4 precursor protein-binding family B member 3 isoform X3 [Ailuropoda melanoleuca]|uniref:amyloid-beta A4 precursor protein-binding family B member 3 isoform X3 n=1 Tax=Ailuropoda melanoleuca TaxID=9646 RepID=UPI000948210D|nr:amyloid-beta A4 precursor protein-binding family B member 3 isoform X3 [Ailuropoda melanoleuca]
MSVGPLASVRLSRSHARKRAPTWGSRGLFTRATPRRAALLGLVLSRPWDLARTPSRICAAPVGPASAERLGLWAQQIRRSSWAEIAGRRRPAGTRSGLCWARITCWPSFWSTAMMTCGGTRVLRGSQDCPLAGERYAMLQVLTIGMCPVAAPSGSAQPGRQEMQRTQARGRKGFGDFGPPRGDPSLVWRAHWTAGTLCPGMVRNPTSRAWNQGLRALLSFPLTRQCFAVRSLGWVEVPEEDLVPGKSSIAVNNCIQQLAQMRSRSRSQPPEGAWGEGQNMLMILKKDAMSLVNPLDHSLIHCQPLVHIRVWGVGSSKGRDFAFVAGDKDSCMLKCHVFRCDVPAKAIASALQGLCAQILSERVGVNGDSPCSSLDPISPEDLPQQVELLDAVSQAAQKYEALYMGTLPVNKAMGMDVLNEAICTLTNRGDQDTWVPAMLSVSDSLMTAHPIQSSQGPASARSSGDQAWCGQAEAGAEEEPLWQCPVRLVTFIGVGRDPHTFGLIADLGRQSFQCAAFWCQPHAGGLSEAVQAACMVQYQKCLVASAARGKAWGAQARARLRLKRTSSVDSPGGPLPLPLLKGGVGGAGAAPRKRGVFSFLDAFRLKPSLLHMP